MSERSKSTVSEETAKKTDRVRLPLFSDNIDRLSKVRSVQEDFVKILQKNEASIGRLERNRFIQYFTSRTNPNQDKYKTLAYELSKRPGNFEGAGSKIWSTVLAQNLEQLSFLKEKLKGANLVDLGGGENEHFRPLAVLFEVKSYINVDLYPFKGDLEYISEQKRLESKGMKDIRLDLPKLAWKRFTGEKRSRLKEPEWAVDRDGFEERPPIGQDIRPHVGSTEQYLIKADMLDFVSRIPDHSADFVLNAIDVAIIGRGEYVCALARELKRATRLGGIVMCMTSETVQAELEKNSFKRVDDAANIFMREDDSESSERGS